MAQSQDTGTDPGIIVGRVDTYDFDRHHGFVRPLLTKSHPLVTKTDTVIIYNDKGRVFDGTPEEPIITSDRVPSGWIRENITPAMGAGSKPRYTYVAMRVYRRSLGLRASAWSVIPRRSTIEDLLRYGGLAYYVGLEIGIMPANREIRGGTWGVLKSWLLSDNQLMLTQSLARTTSNAPIYENGGEVTETINFTSLIVEHDRPDQLTLLARREKAHTLRIVCWRRPPLEAT